jgi:protein tyrosine phosphatase (PTP) superfamily phosphohydrolase (DUF442 family)
LGVLALAATRLDRRGWFGWNNFGVVAPGRVYRSAQPGPELRRVARDHKLASILNLRGGSFDQPWYADEVRTAREEGVDYYDFHMDANRRPTRRELLVLLDLFGHCRYPLLIHCKSGSDRTAMAAALYRMAVEGVGPAEACGAFTIRYGHVPLFGTQRLHEPFDEYRAWLDARRFAHTPERFKEWVARDYRSSDKETVIRPLRPGPRASRLGVTAAVDDAPASTADARPRAPQSQAR